MNLNEAIKIYGICKRLSNYQSSFLLPNGKCLDLDDNGHRDLGIYNFSYKTKSLRIHNNPDSFSVDLHIEFTPTDSQWDIIELLSFNKNLRISILNKDEDILYSGIIEYNDLKTIYNNLRGI